MDFLAKLNQKSPLLRQKTENKAHFRMENETSMALFVDALYQQKPQTIVLITSAMSEAQNVYNALQALGYAKEILFFPSEEIIRLKNITLSKEIIGERIYTMGALAEASKPQIVIMNAVALNRFTPSLQKVTQATIRLQIGQQFDSALLRKMLRENGYVKVDKITASLQFASRGDIVDVFPINHPYPIRIEFEYDQVNALRYFQISTQKSFTNLEAITIYPGSEHLISAAEKDRAIAQMKQFFITDKLDHHLLKVNEYLTTLIDQLSENSFPVELERYLNFFAFETNSIIDFVKNPLIITYNDRTIQTVLKQYYARQKEYHQECIATHTSLEQLVLNYDVNNILEQVKIRTDILNDMLPGFDIKYLHNSQVKEDANLDFLRSYQTAGYTILIGGQNADLLLSIAASLKKHDIPFNTTGIKRGAVNLQILPLSQAFVIESEQFVFLTEQELFYTKRLLPKFIAHYKEGSNLNSYLDLELDDYVVHELYGVGRYKGLKTITSMGISRDYLELEYARQERIYVPVLQIEYVRKYLGRDGYRPSLTRLNTKDWERLKKRVKGEINEIYDKLMALYKNRLQERGLVFAPNFKLEQPLYNSCPFLLTRDQEQSLDEIFLDMSDPYPMDRLLCGDVGFGKTEVALRASMRALVNQYQVCLICPTTILANQHFELFKARLEPLGYQVSLLSRFVGRKEQNQIIQQLKQGQTHILIATHRAIGRDIHFQKLGLLIIDEEQRFGVKQKETIKMKYPHVDVLSLSATPIPRTLQMSLLNLRPISRINTPPPFRNPIQTYVVNYDAGLIKEIVERELSLNGQVFYLANRIMGIERKVQELEAQIPTARVGLIHGQMDGRLIEDVLYRFYRQEINVLVCTTIIENGIDYPNANTLIVENAEMFGLAQLYQIKGRVGRSDRMAYAYFMYHDESCLTPQSIERLKAIRHYTELGSGYKIAEQDLLIRGAGEIIGENQSGFISNIGLDMYTKLFEEVTYERQNNKEKAASHKAQIMQFEAVIKEAVDDKTKISLYERIASIRTLSEIQSFRAEIQDEYGRYPYGIEELLQKQTLDIYANLEPIELIDEDSEDAIIVLEKEPALILRPKLEVLRTLGIRFSLRRPTELRLKKEAGYFDILITILEKIVKMHDDTFKGIQHGSKVSKDY